MKQLIVLIATVVLGVSLSGVVLGMGGNVETIANTATSAIDTGLGYTSGAGFSLLAEE